MPPNDMSAARNHKLTEPPPPPPDDELLLETPLLDDELLELEAPELLLELDELLEAAESATVVTTPVEITTLRMAALPVSAT